MATSDPTCPSCGAALPREPPIAITPEEAARLLSIGRSTLYRLIDAGEIPARRLGGRWMVPRRALERMIDDG